MGLEVQYEDRAYWEKFPTKWEIADLGDLTQLQGIYPKANPVGLRFRACTRFLRETVLVLQINDDPEGNKGRDARVEDLADLPVNGAFKP